MITKKGMNLTMPCGDTAILLFPIKGYTATEADRAVFSISQDGVEHYKHVSKIVDGAAVVALKNDDTALLEAGTYNWDLRIVINAVFDGDEVVDGDGVHDPLALKGALPKFILKEVGARVE